MVPRVGFSDKSGGMIGCEAFPLHFARHATCSRADYDGDIKVDRSARSMHGIIFIVCFIRADMGLQRYGACCIIVRGVCVCVCVGAGVCACMGVRVRAWCASAHCRLSQRLECIRDAGLSRTQARVCTRRYIDGSNKEQQCNTAHGGSLVGWLVSGVGFARRKSYFWLMGEKEGRRGRGEGRTIENRVEFCGITTAAVECCSD